MRKIVLKYYNALFKIGLVNWRKAYLLRPDGPVLLLTECYKGNLVYRLPGTSKRFAYKKIKGQLQSCKIILHVNDFIKPF